MRCTSFDWHVVAWRAVVIVGVCFIIRNEVSQLICEFGTHHFFDSLERVVVRSKTQGYFFINVTRNPGVDNTLYLCAWILDKTQKLLFRQITVQSRSQNVKRKGCCIFS